MKFLDLLKKGSLRLFATATPATPATPATQAQKSRPTVATVATVAVAKVPEQAANDAVQSLKLVIQTAVFTGPASMPASIEPPTDPDAWREPAQAYYDHLPKCHACIAAGLGPGHGLHCEVGAPLWKAYQDLV